MKYGAERDRTVDLVSAIHALFQLSYGPEKRYKPSICSHSSSRVNPPHPQIRSNAGGMPGGVVPGEGPGNEQRNGRRPPRNQPVCSISLSISAYKTAIAWELYKSLASWGAMPIDKPVLTAP